MRIEEIKWLHVESSSKCNAWCPGCARNNNGYGLADGVIEQDLSLDRLKEILARLPHLEGIQFCGNLGDPIAGKNFMSLVAESKKHTDKIQIHTNGSLRTSDWWKRLASELSDIAHDVWFGIDGIGSVHEIYRQGTNYQKIIDNARAFIQAGGHATWQFIPYQHNESQIIECIKLSQDLGFKKFHTIKTFRDWRTKARHYRTGEEFELVPSQVYEKVFFKPRQNQLKKENCMHLTQPSIYLDASGKISPCCFFYNFKSFDSLDDMLKSLDIENSLADPYKKCLECCGS